MLLSKVPLQACVFIGLQAEAAVLGIKVFRRLRVLWKSGSLSVGQDQDLKRLLQACPLLLYRNAFQIPFALFPYKLVMRCWINARYAALATMHIPLCSLSTCLAAYNAKTPRFTPTDVAQEFSAPCSRYTFIASVDRTRTILSATRSPRT